MKKKEKKGIGVKNINTELLINMMESLIQDPWE